MIPAAFEYESPTSVSEAVRLLGKLGDRGKVLAGGHSLVPIMKLRLSQPEVLVDIGRIGELRYVRADGDHIAIGALATHHDVMTNRTVRDRCPILAETAGEIGDVQVRNRGTVGGSLAHADPAADYPATILALDAEIVLQGPRTRRTVKASKFFTGLFQTALKPNELIVEVRVPRMARGQGGAYLKVPNKASHYAVVGVAALVTVKGGEIAEAAVGITGAGAQPARAARVERALRGKKTGDAAAIEKAAAQADQGLDLLSDIHGSAEYRAHLARVYTRRAIEEALRRA